MHGVGTGMRRVGVCGVWGGHMGVWGGTRGVFGDTWDRHTDAQDGLGSQQPAREPVLPDGRQQPALAEEVGAGDGSTDGPGGERAACRQGAGRAQIKCEQGAGRVWA